MKTCVHCLNGGQGKWKACVYKGNPPKARKGQNEIVTYLQAQVPGEVLSTDNKIFAIL